jgi:hypothetical protein
VPAIKGRPRVIQRVQSGGVGCLNRIQCSVEIKHSSRKARIGQETTEPDRSLSVREDPVDDALLVADVQLTTPAHLNDRRRAPAATVLAGKCYPQPWTVHRISVAKDAGRPARHGRGTPHGIARPALPVPHAVARAGERLGRRTHGQVINAHAAAPKTNSDSRYQGQGPSRSSREAATGLALRNP